jgi:hypothetical protein
VHASSAAAGAPYERKYFALELMAVLLQQWLHADTSGNATAGMPVRSTSAQRRPAGSITPTITAKGPGAAAGAGDGGGSGEGFMSALLSPGCVQTLLGCVVDSWDKMRAAASRWVETMATFAYSCRHIMIGCDTLAQLAASSSC